MATPRGSLVTRISLDGGEEIKKELESLGKVGEIAFKKLAAAAKDTKLDTGFGRALATIKLRLRDVQNAGKDLADGFRPVGKAFSEVGDAAGTVAFRVSAITAAAVGAAGAIVALAKSTADTAVNIQRQAQLFGLTTKEFQDLSDLAREEDVQFTDLETVLTKFNLALAKEDASASKAASSTKKHKDETKLLSDTIAGAGVKVTTLADGFSAADRAAAAAGKSTGETSAIMAKLPAGTPVQRLIAFAQAIDGISDSQTRLAEVAKVFGQRQAATFTPFLVKIAENIRDSGALLGRTISELSGDEINKLLGLDDAFDHLTTTIIRTKNHLGASFAEPLAQGIDKVDAIIKENQASIQAFTEGLVNQAVPAIKDLFNAFTGNDQAVSDQGILKFRDTVVSVANDIKTFATQVIPQAFAKIKEIFQGIADTINSIFGTKFTSTEVAVVTIVGAITGAFTLLAAAIGAVAAVVGAAFTAVSVLVGLFGGVAVTIGAIVASLAALIAFNWDAVVADVKETIDKNIESFQRAFDNIKAGFGEVVDSVTTLFDQIDVSGLIDSLVSRFESAVGEIVGAFTNAFNALPDAVKGAIDKILGFLDDLVSKALAIARRIKDAISSALSSTNSAGTRSGATAPQGFASGGMVRGPGTERSDSILAWLSNREFVMQARAVRKYGVAFMNALNRGLLPRDLLRGFNMGGFVQAFRQPMIPAYASGGPVFGNMDFAPAGISGQPLHLHMPGGDVIQVIAQQDAVEQLHRHAMARQVAAAAPKPSWYGR